MKLIQLCRAILVAKKFSHGSFDTILPSFFCFVVAQYIAQGLFRSRTIAVDVHGGIQVRQGRQTKRLRLPQETKRRPGHGRRLQGSTERLLYVQALAAQYADPDPWDTGLLECYRAVVETTQKDFIDNSDWQILYDTNDTTTIARNTFAWKLRPIAISKTTKYKEI